MSQKGKNARAGFTLVEVIVVAVIVLVLAAAAIPMYNGYVKQARQDAIDNLAETAAAAANSFWRKTGSEPDGVQAPGSDPLKLYYDANKHTVTAKKSDGTITVSEKDTYQSKPLSSAPKSYK